MTAIRLPPDFASAITAIRSSEQPLVLWWRHTLKGRATRHLLALPAHHKRPSCGIQVGRYTEDVKPVDVRLDLLKVMLRYRNATRNKN